MYTSYKIIDLHKTVKINSYVLFCHKLFVYPYLLATFAIEGIRERVCFWHLTHYLVSIQLSTSDCTNIPRWTVFTCVWISQSWSPSFSCSGWPCSSPLQNNEIRLFCCFWSNKWSVC